MPTEGLSIRSPNIHWTNYPWRDKEMTFISREDGKFNKPQIQSKCATVGGEGRPRNGIIIFRAAQPDITTEPQRAQY